jgi:hypothetical protein
MINKKTDLNALLFCIGNGMPSFLTWDPQKISVGISIEKLWEQGGNIIKKFPQFKCLPTTNTPHYVHQHMTLLKP